MAQRSVPLLETELQRAAGYGALSVLVDLEDVAFLDSSAMAALVRAHRRLLEAHIGLAILRPQERVSSYLQRTRIDTVIAVAESVAEAVVRSQRLVIEADQLKRQASELCSESRRTRAERVRGHDGS